MYLSFASPYPVGWAPASVTICMSAYHMGTLGAAVNFRVKEHSGNTVRYLAIRRGGVATNVSQACFSDAGAETMPDDPSRAPFRGTWLPEPSAAQPPPSPPGLLADLLNPSGFGGPTVVQVGLGAFFYNVAPGTVGALQHFSVTVCYSPPPEPPTVPPLPPFEPPSFPSSPALPPPPLMPPPGPPPPHCNPTDPFACMGNGVCVSEGVCKCDAGWKGPSCTMLDLLPVKRASPGWNDRPYSTINATWVPSWGACAIYQDNRWWFIVAAKKNHSLGSEELFGMNTHLVLLESVGDVGGPYVHHGEFAGHFRVDCKRLGPNGTIGGASTENDESRPLLMLTTGNVN
eukprot:5611096-Prymnesium_polylepis.1